MIAKITGRLDSVFNSYAIIDVNGVGYRVYSPHSTLQQLTSKQGTTISLFIETHVREDRIHLFGFMQSIEKDAFNMLQNVTGIGTKVALHILSHFSVAKLKQVIIAEDKASLRAIPGIGAKLIDRIMIELKNKITVLVVEENNSGTLTRNASTGIVEDAINVLIALGVSKVEAMQIAHNIYSSSPDISVNELVTTALKQRAK